LDNKPFPKQAIEDAVMGSITSKISRVGGYIRVAGRGTGKGETMAGRAPPPLLSARAVERSNSKFGRFPKALTKVLKLHIL
jgi:hypothetical protein